MQFVSRSSLNFTWYKLGSLQRAAFILLQHAGFRLHVASYFRLEYNVRNRVVSQKL